MHLNKLSFEKTILKFQKIKSASLDILVRKPAKSEADRIIESWSKIGYKNGSKKILVLDQIFPKLKTSQSLNQTEFQHAVFDNTFFMVWYLKKKEGKVWRCYGKRNFCFETPQKWILRDPNMIYTTRSVVPIIFYGGNCDSDWWIFY